MENYNELIKNFLITELEERKDYDLDLYSFELANDITSSININGSVHYSTYKAKEFIRLNFNFMGEVVDYYKENLDMVINPFSEPENAEVLAYICGVESLLNQSKALREADEDSEHSKITLTNELIEVIISELENLTINL